MAVVDVLVKTGDVVEVDTPLVTLETDKASMDVPATAAGKVTEVLLKRGDKVVQGLAHCAARVRRRGSRGGRTGERGACTAAAARGAHRDRRRHGPHAGARPAAAPRAPARTSTAARSCWYSAPGRAATPPHSAPPTSGSR